MAKRKLNRLTTDHPHDNLSTLLNFAYAKDQRVVLTYAGGEDDIDLCEYVSREARERGCPMTPEDVMEGGCGECDCPMTVLNIAAVQAAELRGRLKMIEDILGDTYDLDHLRELIKNEKKEE